MTHDNTTNNRARLTPPLLARGGPAAGVAHVQKCCSRRVSTSTLAHLRANQKYGTNLSASGGALFLLARSKAKRSGSRTNHLLIPGNLQVAIISPPVRVSVFISFERANLFVPAANQLARSASRVTREPASKSVVCLAPEVEQRSQPAKSPSTSTHALLRCEFVMSHAGPGRLINSTAHSFGCLSGGGGGGGSHFDTLATLGDKMKLLRTLTPRRVGDWRCGPLIAIVGLLVPSRVL